MEEASERHATSGDHPFARILVIGPDSALAQAIADVLPRATTRVVDADRAQALASAWCPTLLFLDVRDAGDLGLMRRLLADAPDAPVVIAAEPPHARAGLRAGAFAAIPRAPGIAAMRQVARDVLVEHEDMSLPAVE